MKLTSEVKAAKKDYFSVKWLVQTANYIEKVSSSALHYTKRVNKCPKIEYPNVEMLCINQGA